MKLVPVNKDSKNYHLKLDILQISGWLVVLVLCILGIVPWWFLLVQFLIGFKGFIIKFRFEK